MKKCFQKTNTQKHIVHCMCTLLYTNVFQYCGGGGGRGGAGGGGGGK